MASVRNWTCISESIDAERGGSSLTLPKTQDLAPKHWAHNCFEEYAMRSELKSIVQWLEGTDETYWASKIALAKNCLATMRQRTKPINDPGKPGSGSAQARVVSPDLGKLNRAIPHVESMLYAMRRKERVKALESGRVAVAELVMTRRSAEYPKPASVSVVPL
jgi:hypothetical protein